MARNKNHARIARRQESDKNTRTQESCLARHFLPRQPRLYLHESCQKVKICFFRQESCTEGMAKESCLISKKNKNLDRSKSRSSTSVNTKFISNTFLVSVHKRYPCKYNILQAIQNLTNTRYE